MSRAKKQPKYPEPGSVYPIVGKCNVVACLEQAVCEVKEGGFSGRLLRLCEKCAETLSADPRFNMSIVGRGLRQ